MLFWSCILSHIRQSLFTGLSGQLNFPLALSGRTGYYYDGSGSRAIRIVPDEESRSGADKHNPDDMQSTEVTNVDECGGTV
jgi:hypothetical protein